MTITIKVEESLLISPTWPLYLECFQELNRHTIQRHLMTIPEFGVVMADARILKYLAFNKENELVGLAAYTNRLEAVSLISQEYFKYNYPEHYQQDRIWYCLFVAVKNHTPGVFVELVTKMYRKAQENESIICLDICAYNEKMYQLPRAILDQMIRLNPMVRFDRADKQSYFIYTT